MTPLALAGLIFGSMLLCMAVRFPIAVSMFIAGAIGYIGQTGWEPFSNFMNTQAFARFAGYDLSVIPLFILMGYFATKGGISKDLFAFAAAAMGRFKGGMAMASVLACAAFGAVSGSSVATAATITGVALPEMKRHGYSGRLATGVLSAGGTLGIQFPPSVVLVVYAILTEQNITKTFLAAYVPAILAALGYLVVIAIYVRLHPGHAPEARAASGAEVAQAAAGVWPIALIFVAVFGGIYGGIFTPTEGAAIGATLTFIITLLQRKLTLQKAVESIRTTAVTSGMIFMIFIGADMMNAALALSQLPNQLADLIAHAAIPPVVVMAIIMLFYVVLGCVMDEMSMILLTVPVIFPVIMGLDFFGLEASDKALWFGILILTVCAIGMIFPPVGLNVYVMNGLAKDVPMIETYKGVMIFLAWDFIRLALLILFPGITLWLVHLLT